MAVRQPRRLARRGLLAEAGEVGLDVGGGVDSESGGRGEVKSDVAIRIDCADNAGPSTSSLSSASVSASASGSGATAVLVLSRRTRPRDHISHATTTAAAVASIDTVSANHRVRRRLSHNPSDTGAAVAEGSAVRDALRRRTRSRLRLAPYGSVLADDVDHVIADIATPDHASNSDHRPSSWRNPVMPFNEDHYTSYHHAADSSLFATMAEIQQQATLAARLSSSRVITRVAELSIPPRRQPRHGTDLSRGTLQALREVSASWQYPSGLQYPCDPLQTYFAPTSALSSSYTAALSWPYAAATAMAGGSSYVGRAAASAVSVLGTLPLPLSLLAAGAHDPLWHPPPPLLAPDTRALMQQMLDAIEEVETADGLTFEELLRLEEAIVQHASAHRVSHLADAAPDVDHMSYEELMELEERIGNVPTGVTEAVLQRLPVEHYRSATNAAGRCAVCQEDYKDCDEVCSLPCSHEYHYGCIGQWLSLKNVCPICKSAVA
eukprot:jgi/Chlat1/1221/Chrsp115S01678